MMLQTLFDNIWTIDNLILEFQAAAAGDGGDGGKKKKKKKKAAK